jgi:hypothetical protein
MDPRREASQIQKHFARYHDTIGEAIIYFRFDADTSAYDRVYDEGFRKYHEGMRIAILWADQMEAVEDYAPEGRRPTQRCRLAVSARCMYEAGISITEAHGNRLEDISPSTIWRRDRNHDIFWYDSRFYEVSGFQIRGRVQGEDVIIGVTGIESFKEDDMILDFPPGSVIIPDPEPIPFTIIVTPDPENPYGYSFDVTDDPDHHVDWDYGDGESEENVLCSETVEHIYGDAGTYTVTAYCHRETITTEIDVAPGPGYGMGQYGIIQPYGGYSHVPNPLEVP